MPARAGCVWSLAVPSRGLDRLSLTLFDRYPRHGHHERAVRRLGALARRYSSAQQRRHGVGPRRHATPYAVFHLQERGVIFIPPGARVYEGMVIGEYSRDVDLNVNICREKKLTNIRAAGRDENIIISPHREMGLEEGLDWIADEELVEVTPQSIRLRKKVLKQVRTARNGARKKRTRCSAKKLQGFVCRAIRHAKRTERRTVDIRAPASADQLEQPQNAYGRVLASSGVSILSHKFALTNIT